MKMTNYNDMKLADIEPHLSRAENLIRHMSQKTFMEELENMLELYAIQSVTETLRHLNAKKNKR